MDKIINGLRDENAFLGTTPDSLYIFQKKITIIRNNRRAAHSSKLLITTPSEHVENVLIYQFLHYLVLLKF